MKLGDIFLKLNQDYALSDEKSQQQLKADLVQWETEAKTEEASQIQKQYAKIHENVLVKLLMPILYIFVRKSFNEIINGEPEERFSDRF